MRDMGQLAICSWIVYIVVIAILVVLVVQWFNKLRIHMWIVKLIVSLFALRRQCWQTVDLSYMRAWGKGSFQAFSSLEFFYSWLVSLFVFIYLFH